MSCQEILSVLHAFSCGSVKVSGMILASYVFFVSPSWLEEENCINGCDGTGELTKVITIRPSFYGDHIYFC